MSQANIIRQCFSILKTKGQTSNSQIKNYIKQEHGLDVTSQQIHSLLGPESFRDGGAIDKQSFVDVKKMVHKQFDGDINKVRETLDVLDYLGGIAK